MTSAKLSIAFYVMM